MCPISATGRSPVHPPRTPERRHGNNLRTRGSLEISPTRLREVRTSTCSRRPIALRSRMSSSPGCRTGRLVLRRRASSLCRRRLEQSRAPTRPGVSWEFLLRSALRLVGEILEETRHPTSAEIVEVHPRRRDRDAHLARTVRLRCRAFPLSSPSVVAQPSSSGSHRGRHRSPILDIAPDELPAQSLPSAMVSAARRVDA